MVVPQPNRDLEVNVPFPTRNASLQDMPKVEFVKIRCPFRAMVGLVGFGVSIALPGRKLDG